MTLSFTQFTVTHLLGGTDKTPLGQNPTRTKPHWTKPHWTKPHCYFWQGGQNPTPTQKRPTNLKQQRACLLNSKPLGQPPVFRHQSSPLSPSINRLCLTQASGAPEIRVRAQGTLDATAFFVYPSQAVTTEDCIATYSFLTDNAGVLTRFPDFIHIYIYIEPKFWFSGPRGRVGKVAVFQRS